MEPKIIMSLKQLYKSLSCFFICLKQIDLQQFDKSTLQHLLQQLKTKKVLKDQKLKQVHQKLKAINLKRSQQLIQNKPHKYNAFLNISLLSKNNNKSLTMCQTDDTLNSINNSQLTKNQIQFRNLQTVNQSRLIDKFNFINNTSMMNQSVSYMNKSVLDLQKCKYFQGMIINGQMKIKMKIIDNKTGKEISSHFAIDSYEKDNLITHQNFQKLGFQTEGKFKQKGSKNVTFQLQVEGKIHQFKLHKSQNVLGLNFLQAHGAILNGSFRQHDRKCQLILTQ